MTTHRITIIALIVLSSFFLAGAKKPHKKLNHSPHTAKTTEVKQTKPLNLAIPQALVKEIKPEQPEPNSSIFDLEKKSKEGAVGLRGQVILSQELEAGKMRSADGAGIMLDFHH